MCISKLLGDPGNEELVAAKLAQGISIINYHANYSPLKMEELQFPRHWLYCLTEYQRLNRHSQAMKSKTIFTPLPHCDCVTILKARFFRFYQNVLSLDR